MIFHLYDVNTIIIFDHKVIRGTHFFLADQDTTRLNMLFFFKFKREGISYKRGRLNTYRPCKLIFKNPMCWLWQ